MPIDGTLYPDLPQPPRSLDTQEARADYVHRVCTAWDHGVQPDAATFAWLSGWKDVFDRFPVVTSPAYHAMRAWFGWEQVAIPPGLHAPVPRYVEYDRIENRPDDPCEEWI
jgi:hypothetical protein